VRPGRTASTHVCGFLIPILPLEWALCLLDLGVGYLVVQGRLVGRLAGQEPVVFAIEVATGTAEERVDLTILERYSRL
jgi:hypothetical protein